MRRAVIAWVVFLALSGAVPRIAQAQAQAQVPGGCAGPVFPLDRSWVVLDDGNNLRESGGADYAQARVLGVLNAWEEVTVLARQARWARVRTAKGQEGWVNDRCLAPYADVIRGSAVVKGYDPKDNCAYSPEWKTAFTADLDGDGRASTLKMVCRPWWGCSNHSVAVFGPDNALRYQGPDHGPSPLIFCLCDAGAYWPEVLGDIDGDGKAELIAEHSPSDVSLSTHTILRWNGRGFTPLRQDVALIEDKASPGFFAYTPRSAEAARDEREPRWIMSVSGLDPKRNLIASVYQYTRNAKTGDKDLHVGEGRFAARDTGFQLIGWIKPMAVSR